MIAWYVLTVLGVPGKVRFFCQDETRIGLKTISGHRWQEGSQVEVGRQNKSKCIRKREALYMIGINRLISRQDC